MCKNIAAFFDIDGTIYRDSLMVEHFKTLTKFNIINENFWHNHAKKTYENWNKRQGNYEDYLNEVVEAYVEALKGVNLDDVKFTSKYVINQKSERVYKYTRSIIQYHHSKGHIIIFISGSPDFLVKNMAQKYNATDYKGSEYVFKDDYFTGKIIPMWNSDSKDGAINYFTQKYNLDLDKSFAYGDTNGDFSMLKRVGNPVAINPAKELVLRLKEDDSINERACIVVERKDTIFKIKPKDAILFDI